MSPTDVEAAVSRRARLRALRDVLTSHESELQDALKPTRLCRHNSFAFGLGRTKIRPPKSRTR
jgi:hypothetical protein